MTGLTGSMERDRNRRENVMANDMEWRELRVGIEKALEERQHVLRARFVEHEERQVEQGRRIRKLERGLQTVFRHLKDLKEIIMSPDDSGEFLLFTFYTN